MQGSSEPNSYVREGVKNRKEVYVGLFWKFWFERVNRLNSIKENWNCIRALPLEQE